MSGLLELMRAAVAPTMAARTGYVQGQGIKEERIRDQKREKTELDRRSRLDQMQETIARENLERARNKDRREQAAAEREAKAPRTPVRGTPEYEAMLGREERIRGEADVRYRKPERPSTADDRDARTRQRQYQRQITTLKRNLHTRFNGAASLVDPDMIEEERRRIQDEYYSARADLAAEFEDVAPDEDIDPSLRRRNAPAARATPSAAGPAANTTPAAGTKRPITRDQADYLRTRQGLSDAEISARYIVR